ncbi:MULTISPECIES: hypothetical protein [Streptomyces]|uniref:Uncharacterized protein n=2 Tax=Streptomyces TaxID=1883 RepID=A0A124EBV8_9ACTN|nr:MULTISPECIES: hypothetical protein [Streptomyces]KUH35721.1 hypothetical protein ATE80_27500 [Streptomyces kanasensis]UUS30946.1 hypothetical protein NRO40_08915 [Streptomyces changanensis]
MQTAALDNARWCAAVCRAHDLPPGTFGDRAWTSARRTPPLYPDAVTLRADATPEDVLGGVDRTSPGCSVKDGFAALDLAPHGFRVLFEARWIHRAAGPPPTAPPTPWEPVRTAGALAAWERAWSGGSTPGPFRPALLADPGVTVLAGRAPDGRITSGAVLSHGTGSGSGAGAGPGTGTGTAQATRAGTGTAEDTGTGVVGVSNLFGPAAEAWPGCLAAAAARHPGLPVVGYEHGDDLATALRYGFTDAGPLRIWLADD